MQRSPVVRILFALFFVTLATPSWAQRARIELVDRIVAVVNNDVITQFEFNERLRVVQRQLEGQGIKLPPREVLEKQLLERVINEKVQLQFAAETGIRVDDAMLDRAIGRIAEGNRMSLDGFRQALEKDGMSFTKFREDIRNEIILSRVKEREADNRVTVTESEVEHFFASQAAAQGSDTEFNVGHILIQVPEQASPEQIQTRKARAEQALNELKKGADFAQVSASFSDAPNALQGGELGWRSASRLPQLFSDALNALQPGQTSGLLRSPNGFHLLKLIDKRGRDVPLVVTQTHARHILIKTSELISEADAKRRLTELKERLDNGAGFAELARLQSEDGSAAKGGDLGWLSPGDTVPEFEKAMDALAANTVSEPIRSPFGWHLIQVLERRREDVTQEKQKLKARLEIRERKADEAYQEFVRQLRDRAYVEYRTEDR
ncbi:MAG: peptidylprolyl isomerase [Hydrogenophilales bacterium]|nr:peptidylprolyl isomerase [Hydrogenophilales bacterium]